MNDIKIIKSKRKTLALEINKNLEVIVRAPLKTSKSQINSFINEHENWIGKSLAKMKARTKNLPQYTSDEQEIKRLKLQAEKIICPKIDYYASVLGVEPKRVSFNRAKTRFGSCSRENNLNFSCYLMLYDEKAIDYVVVHELCHIIQKNHSKSFYSLVESVLPDYKDRIKLLKGEA